MNEEGDSNLTQPILSRVFRSDPTAARLLRRLYGFDHNEGSNRQTKVTRQVQPKPLLQPKWKNVNNKVSSEDPHMSRFNKEKASAISVPNFNLTKSNKLSIVKVDMVPHRKSMEACKGALKENALYSQSYRPPPNSSFKKVSYEDEKIRLGEIFRYKGGNALPIMPPIEPCELLPCDHNKANSIDAKRRQNSRLARISSDLVLSQNVCVPQTQGRKSDSLKDQIMMEIAEREDFRQSHIGDLCENLKRRLDEEICSRMEELLRLDPKFDCSSISRELNEKYY